MVFSFLRSRLGFSAVKKTGAKSREEGQYKKLPKTLKELGPSYNALIRELAKR